VNPITAEPEVTRSHGSGCIALCYTRPGD
jgi:hypothetical protein